MLSGSCSSRARGGRRTSGRLRTPDAPSIASIVEAIVAVIDLLRACRACGDDTLKTLLRAPKMRSILAAANRQRTRTAREVEPAVRRASRRPPLPPSRYDRQRLYEEVWMEPTQKVAQRYGVSDVAIAKA